MGFWRDSSDRLTFDLAGVAAEDYPALCSDIVDSFGLSPLGEIVIGPEQMFWDFQRDEEVVGLDWDIWMEFMVVAKNEAAEGLVREIAKWLAR